MIDLMSAYVFLINKEYKKLNELERSAIKKNLISVINEL